jgi:SH3-like domain-containing protein
MSAFRVLGCALLGLALASAPAHAQTSPPQGTLQPPKPGTAKPGPAPTPPKAAPIPAVTRSAPLQDGSVLGHSTPGKPPPVVAAGKNAHAQKPPAPKQAAKPPAKPAATAPAKPASPAKPAAAAAAAGATAAVIATTPAVKPTEPPPAAAEKPPAPDPTSGSATSQPLPRWAALRSDEVNLRKGPGQRYPIEWVYRRRELPVLITREFEVWRLIEDQDGVKGWVHSATLTGRRSFAVKGPDATLRSRARDDADPVAILKPGVVGHINACTATADWCDVSAGGFKGWLKRSALWGISPGESVGS